MKRLLKTILLKTLPVSAYIALVELRNKTGQSGFKVASKDFFLQLLAKKKDLFFIQVGANDGVKNDPIFSFVKKYHWRGILVEPLPDFFTRLKKNYAGETQLVFENVGIADEEAIMSFYYLPPEYKEPDWLQQIGSFDRNSIEYNLASLPELIERVETKKIQAITLQALLDKNNASHIDLLIIDAEGFEYKILSQLDKLKYRVDYILFEWGCMPGETLDSLTAFLQKIGYKLYACGGDILAICKK